MKGLLSIGPLMWQRLFASWRLLLVLAFGILVAATLMAISPVYTRVMNDLGLQESLQDRLQSSSRNGFVMVPTPLGDAAAVRRQQELAQAMSEEIGWFVQDEVRVGTLPDMGVERAGSLRATPGNTFLLRFIGTSGLDQRIRIVEGRAAIPTDDPSNLEVVVPVETALRMDASLGDVVESVFVYDDCNRPLATDDPEQAQENRRFACTPQTFIDVHITATVVGFIEQLDAEDPYWTANSINFNRPATNPVGPVKRVTLPIVMPEESFFNALPKILPSFPSEFRLVGLIDPSRLNSANLDEARDSLSRLRNRIEELEAIPDLSTANSLASFENRASFNQVTLILLLIQVVGIAVYYVVLVSTLLAERRTEEIAMLRSRGATVGQLVVMSASEALALGLVAALLAPFLASGAIAALGKTGTFESVSGGDFLPFTIVPVAFLFALGGAAIAAIAVVVPAFFAARNGMVVFLRSSARPGQPLLQRYYLDFAIVGLAAFALWQLSQRGSVFDPGGVGGWSADPLLLLSPLLLILAVGAMMFRFLPLLLRLATKLLATTSGPGVTLGLWQLTRSPARYTQLALLVVMAAAVGTFTATYGETTDRSQEERALYAAGSDIRLTGLGDLQRDLGPEATMRLEEVDGVERAVTATRQTMSLGPLPAFGAPVNVLGIDPEGASDVMWWREDFSDRPLDETLVRLQSSPIQTHGLPLPGEPISASIWVNPIGARPDTTLWLRTLDANGTFRYHQFGALDFQGYEQMTATFDAKSRGIQYPISIVAIMMTQIRSLNDASREMFLDDLTVLSASGEEVVIEDFEDTFPWEVVRTTTRERDKVEQSSQGVHSGARAAHFRFLSGSGLELRGMTFADASFPLAALASSQLLERTGLQPGSEVELVFGKLLIPLTIQGSVDYFPTMYDGGAGFVIVNQDDLYYYAGVTNQLVAARAPTEAWLRLTTDEEARENVKSSFLGSFAIPSGQIIDSQTILSDVRSDPIIRAGGSGILLVALVAAFAILALGFALTLYLGGQARSVEVSVMRAVGISPRQLVTMISLEYLLIAVIGLAIGAIAGLRISETMLSYLNVTDSGGRVVPEFDLITRWDTVAIAFGAVGVAFIGGVLALAGYFLRLPVSRIIRITR